MTAKSDHRPYRLGLLVGDGIGPEIVPPAAGVVEAAMQAVGARVDWVPLPFGRKAIDDFGTAVPPRTLEGLSSVDAWMVGPHDNASYPEPQRSTLNPSGTLRKQFDLFANIRPARALPGSSAIVPGTDLVVVRENTQGFYADRNTYAGTGEFMPTPDVAISLGIITRSAVDRIARVAFELARHRRKKVTIVHKANVLWMTTGLFRDVCLDVAHEYPDVEVDEAHIDAMMVHLVRHAERFDVIVTENMFGDILSDLTGEIVGSLGMAPSINASETRAMAQASHGAAPDIAGRNIANPIAMILSGAMLLDWLGSRNGDDAAVRAARRIDEAVAETVASGVVTPDMAGSASTRDVAAAVMDRVAVRPSP
jgi:3-isopropylmalate dehydrogenase